jgi:hypothetical protein
MEFFRIQQCLLAVLYVVFCGLLITFNTFFSDKDSSASKIMAAIICKAFGDFCNGCTKVICAPLTLCCDSVSSLCSNPFCIYVVVTVAFNVPPIAMGVTPIVQSFPSCNATIWLLVDMIFCAVNIWAAFYVAIKYNTRTDGDQSSRGFNRAKDILCYNPSIAVYMIVSIGFFALLIVGISGTEATGSCEDTNVRDIVKVCVGLGFGFFVAGFIALCISLCCSCCCPCMGNDSGHNNIVYQMPGQGQSQNDASNNGIYGINDVESNTEFPTATAVPAHAQSEPIYATVINDPEPSAPPTENGESKAASSGAKVGGKLGNVLNTNDKTKAKLEKTGAKVGVAAQKGIQSIKNMVRMSTNGRSA